ncbi:MAG TPA: DUF4349 domain-containing protein [Solirubrobacteraceae bacterium]|nr:DUF4349 domain-containing protein [Solirubrobacteraceae bacterium]
MRRRDLLNPDEERELDALERALAGEPVEPDLHELEDLVRDIRASAPEMTPAFAARLEHEVAEGFPNPAPRPPRRRPQRWMLLPAAGTLAVALIALVVVLGQTGGGGTEGTQFSATGGDEGAAAVLEDAPAAGGTGGVARDSASPTDESAPEPSARRSPAPQASQATTPPPPVAQSRPRPTAVTKSAARRQVERAAQLILETPSGKVEETSDDVIRTVDRFDGIVASSSIGSDDEDGGEATFDLRIPSDRLDDALAALSKLGHVAERRQQLEDITASFTSVQDRLADARAERRGLLKALGRATTQSQIAGLRAQLRSARSQISRLEGDLNSLRRRADLSTVSLTVRGVEGAGAGSGGGDWSPGDAAADALRVLEVMAGVALIALAISVPLGLLGAAIALGARSARRRDRERALDPA